MHLKHLERSRRDIPRFCMLPSPACLSAASYRLDRCASAPRGVKICAVGTLHSCGKGWWFFLSQLEFHMDPPPSCDVSQYSSSGFSSVHLVFPCSDSVDLSRWGLPYRSKVSEEGSKEAQSTTIDQSNLHRVGEQEGLFSLESPSGRKYSWSAYLFSVAAVTITVKVVT